MTRSKETPMDFEWTNRPVTKPVWATDADSGTPRKRPFAEANSASPLESQPPQFGSVTGSTYLFNVPERTPSTPHKPDWTPPATPFMAKVQDVTMTEASPPSTNEKAQPEAERLIAVGALKRVFARRQKAKGRSRLSKEATTETDEDASEDGEGCEDEDRTVSRAVMNRTSNHFTLNVPGATRSQSDTPYILLGYLQFFFNLALVMVFLYLLIQFILTVQRDVELRVSEYSMEIVQEIAQCAMQYKTNLCATNPIPAMSHQCGVWETCMNRDPTKVGRARVGAELIAEVVNGFVEPISWKTLAFTLTSLSFLTVFINSLLSLYRSRHNPSNAQTHPRIMPSDPFQPVAPHSQHLLNAPADWRKSWRNSQVEEMPSRRRKLTSGSAVDIK